MKRLGKVALVAALGGVAALAAFALAFAVAIDAPNPLPAPERGARFSRVWIVEPGGQRSGPVSLHVEGDRVTSIGSALLDQDAFDGAFVIPGLTDMHAHFPATGFPGDEQYTALLFLRHGITAVRLTGQAPPEGIEQWRRRVAEGSRSGPHFFSCGPIIDGADPVIPGAGSVTNPEQARAAVDEWAQRGVDCIKAYDRLDLETTIALREAAHERGLPIIGHTPQAVSFEAARLDDVQHLRGVHPPFIDEPMRYPLFLRAWHRLDEAWIAHVIEVSRRYQIAHTPTLVAVEGTVVSRPWSPWRSGPTMQLWLPHLRDGLWSGEVGFSPGRFASDADAEMVRSSMRQMSRMVGALHAAGVPIHTGTDANAPNVVPGASLHRELQLLVDAGLTPDQALEASTRVSPAFLGISGAGSLRTGDRADFALFRDDPTRDIGALSTLLGIVRDGRLYTTDDLDARLERYRAHYANFGFDRVVMPTLRAALRTLTGWIRR